MTSSTDSWGVADRTGVTVCGRGVAGAPADCLVATIGVGADADHVSDALREASETTVAVGERLREFGVDERDVTTTDITTSARWDDAGRHVVGYRARHLLRIRCRDLGAAGGVLGAVVELGGDAMTIDQVQLDISDQTALETQAREHAFADARGRATHYAALAGRDLGQVDDLTDVPVSPGPRPLGLAFAAKAGAGPVETGELTVQAVVTVRWSWR